MTPSIDDRPQPVGAVTKCPKSVPTPKGQWPSLIGDPPLSPLLDVSFPVKQTVHAPVEAFDEGVLIGLARLDVVDRHAMRDGPVEKRLCEKLGPIVDPHRDRAAVDGHQVLQVLHDTTTGQRDAQRDIQAFTIPFIDAGERADPPTVLS